MLAWLGSESSSPVMLTVDCAPSCMEVPERKSSLPVGRAMVYVHGCEALNTLPALVKSSAAEYWPQLTACNGMLSN